MLSLARSFVPRTLSRSIAQRAATLHTLPHLPYAYNVNAHTLTLPISPLNYSDLEPLGIRAPYLYRNHGASSLEAPPSLRERPQRGRRRIRQGAVDPRKDRSPGGA